MSWISASVARESIVLAIAASATARRKRIEGRDGEAARQEAIADHEIGVVCRVTGVKEPSVRAAVEKHADAIAETLNLLVRE